MGAGADRTEVERTLAQLARVGRVSSVNQATGTAQVQFEEDDLVSGDLRVLHQGAADKWMPAVGSQVLCLFLPVGLEVGFILGTTTSDADPPPTAAAARVVAGDDLRLGGEGASKGMARVGDTVRVTIQPLSIVVGPPPPAVGPPVGAGPLTALEVTGVITSGSATVKGKD